MSERFTNRFSEFWLEDGILHFIYKSGVSLNLEAARIIVNDRIKFQKEIEYPILCDTRGINSTDKEARDFLAREGSIVATAVAFLVNGNISNVITSFFIKKSQPPIPTGIFADKSEAL